MLLYMEVICLSSLKLPIRSFTASRSIEYLCNMLLYMEVDLPVFYKTAYQVIHSL
jgi:hypothetical protein